MGRRGPRLRCDRGRRGASTPPRAPVHLDRQHARCSTTASASTSCCPTTSCITWAPDELDAFADQSRRLSRGIVLHGDIERGRIAYALYTIGHHPVRARHVPAHRRAPLDPAQLPGAELAAVLGDRGAWSGPVPFRLLATATAPPMTDVVVVGAGPVGTLLAGELDPPRGRRARSGAAPDPGAWDPRDRRARTGARRPRTVRSDRASARPRRRGCHAASAPAGDAAARHRALRSALDPLPVRRDASPGRDGGRPGRRLAPAPERGREVTAVRPRSLRRRARGDPSRGPPTARSSTQPLRSWCSPVGGHRGRWCIGPGAVPTTTYPDRYLMSDIVIPDRPDADTAIVNLAPGGVLESFPLPGSMRRIVAWDAAVGGCGAGRVLDPVGRASGTGAMARDAASWQDRGASAAASDSDAAHPILMPSGWSDCERPCALAARRPSPTRSRPPRRSVSAG